MQSAVRAWRCTARWIPAFAGMTQELVIQASAETTPHLVIPANAGIHLLRRAHCGH